MTARGRRDELLALLALILVTAGILGGVALLGNGDEERSEAAPPESTASGPADPTGDTTTDAEPTDGEPTDGATADPTGEEDADQDGDPADDAEASDPLPAPACRLLPRADVERIFGPLGAAGTVRQEHLQRAPRRGEAAGDVRSRGGLTTRCGYVFDDLAGHTLDVAVTSYDAAGDVRRQWAKLRAGDRQSRPVPGTDGNVVELPGQRAFVARVGDLLVELRYATAGDAARQTPLSARELAWQRPRMRQAVARVAAVRADGDTTPQPTSTGLATGLGGTAFVEPCTLLTDEAFQALGGAAPGPLLVDTSYVARDRFADVPVASCERTGRAGTKARSRETLAVVEVRLASGPAAAEEAQAKHLDNRYPQGTRITELDTEAGPAYAVDAGGTEAWPWRTRALHVVVGRYEITLSALRDVGPGRRYGSPVSDRQLAAAAPLLAAGLPEQP